MIALSRRLRDRTSELMFAAPVTHVYRPLDYAWVLHESYLRAFATSEKEVLLVGMNPGPWGMAQTGIPFGEVGMVRGWLGLTAEVDRPKNEHPKRPILGLACGRSEVSGARFWGWAANRFSRAGDFFSRFFVANYCPLCFMESSGRNRTPDKLAANEREELFAACDEALVKTVQLLRPRLVLGVGAFAEKQVRSALARWEIQIGRIPHPSPASPAANRGWSKQAEAALRSMGVRIP